MFIEDFERDAVVCPEKFHAFNFRRAHQMQIITYTVVIILYTYISRRFVRNDMYEWDVYYIN